MTRRRPRRPLTACALVLVASTLFGCSPAPTPTPSPTPVFASEEEAFAAAEETYRAFIAHLNAVDTRDPATFEPLFDLSSGEFEEADREAYSRMHADGVVLDGDTSIVSFQGLKSDSPFATASSHVCLDVSAVTVIDSSGNSLVDSTRPDVYALTVKFVENRSRMLIDSAELNSEIACDE